MLYLTCAACLDWSRRKDIQARTVKGRLSCTGRRYQAGTIRGRPNWFGSLLPEVQGTSSWFISWMLEQHEDQAQSLKSSSSAESRAEKKCRVEAQNAQVQNSSSADQVQCTRAVIECKDRYKRSDRVQIRSPVMYNILAERPAGRSARTRELLQREERLARGAHLGRERIYMLLKSSVCLVTRADGRVEAQNAQVQNSSSADQVQCTRAVIECKDRYKRSDRVQIRSPVMYNILAERPAGRSARTRELLQQEERLAREHDRRFSSEDDEGQLERGSADKSKLEEFLKSGCKREEKK
ncbi:hypothetical protein F511_33870 [Dorcoceras hygrometricum]|uniref:Uncharacterized protein n=1 Tax=Dorcoceras hygrometricum TaxID=472368 RepID=A0A2Z7BEV7_9LAMI|nr:hypothetical protein F511_33870 [Dorcoceras hygrometricum]